MRDEKNAGYCCLLIAIFCGVNAAEARKLYQYGPEHPLCRKILKKHVRDPSLKHIGREQSKIVMKPPFRVIKVGTSVRVPKQSFDNWLNAAAN